MKTHFFLKIAAVAAIFAVSAVAQATTITFDSLTTSSSVGTVGDTYTEGGLQFGSTYTPSGAGLIVWGTGNSFNADPTGATLLENWIGYSLIVNKVGGGSFSLNSIDLADGYNNGVGGNVAFSYVDGAGSHSESLALDAHKGLTTFDLNLTGVTSFSILQSAPYFQLDNVVVNATSAVPEPASLGLMLAGLALVGAVARRRKA